MENSQVVEDTSNFFAQKEFLFDHVFGADSRNSQVYESLVLPVVSRFVGGFNGTVRRLSPFTDRQMDMPVATCCCSFSLLD